MTTTIEKLQRRSAALAAVRGYFARAGFLEHDPFALVPGPGLEPHIDPLSVVVRTTFDGAAVERFLHTSPELTLKRIVAAGAERVYALGHVFRDGEKTARHVPEFSLVEWYRARASLAVLVDDVRALCADVARALAVTPPFTVDRDWPRASVAELFARHAHIDLDRALDETNAGNARALVDAARANGFALRPDADFDDAFAHVMASAVEPALPADTPVVVTRWPRQMAVLARLCDDDARYAARFEIYVRGLELANAFDELTDAREQRARFLDDNATRRALGKRALPLDEEFLAALPSVPQTVGIALGFDRLLMAITGTSSINDVLPLPFR